MRRGIILIAMMLAACGGGGDRKERPRGASAKPAARPSMPGHDSATIKQCESTLLASNVKFQPLPDERKGGGCLVYGAIKLLDIGVPVTNLGAMTCPLGATFAAWARHGAMPAARVYFGTELVRIDTMGTYSCRPIAGSGKLSEHGKSNAVDIAAFVLADGRRISVVRDWNGGDEQARAFLRRIRESACKRFGTVLSPDYNAAHRDHFHFDMSGKDYCR